jgi:MFS family permease
MKNKSVLLRVLLAIGLSASCFLFATTSEFSLYIIFISIMGILSGLVYTTTLELLLQINEKRKGRIAGFFEASIGIGTFISPILGSSVLGFGYVATYVVAASVSTAIAALALVIYLIFTFRK